jgi:hypothetical protein
MISSLTAAALTGVPSENVRPGRMWKVTSVPVLLYVQLEASPGSGSPCALMVVSDA